MSFRIGGTEEQVDQSTKESIRRKYSTEDEIKLLRRAIAALANGDPLPGDFIVYNGFVERVVGKRRLLKDDGNEAD